MTIAVILGSRLEEWKYRRIVFSELTQRRRWRQRGRQKIKRFRLTKQQLCTCITLFCTFLCRRCTTTTWKRLISRFVGDVNARQRLYTSFPTLRYSLLEFNSIKNCNIWRTDWDGISAIKIEAARIHFLSHVFVAIAVVVLKRSFVSMTTVIIAL